ncbi:MAG TPA: DUF1552 domain-containing protein [Polyangia bacterium]
MSAAGRRTPSPPALSRRVFLRGAAGAGLALPLLNDLVPGWARAAGAASFPKRLVILFSPNGTNQPDFFGPGDTKTLTLGPILQPLASHKNDLIVVDGIDEPAASASPGDPHGAGIGCLLTGKKLQSGSLFPSSSGGAASGWADNVSIDQLIANSVAGTPLRSLELAGKRAASSLWSRLSYRGPADPVTPEDDPQRVWDRLFVPPRVSGHRKKILDNVRKELSALGPKLSADDARKLQQHLDAVTNLEARVGGGASPAKAPPRPTVTQTSAVAVGASGQQAASAANDVDFPKILKAHLDLVAGAFACDLTRVATVIMAPSASNLVPSWLTFNGAPITEGHADLSHASASDSAAQAKLTLINAWYAQQIADFIAGLKAVPEGAGTLFDSTLVVWLNELGSGSAHSHTRLPVLLAGSAQGYFKTGRYVNVPSGTYSMNDVLVSVANAMGVKPTATDDALRPYQNQFGDPAFCRGSLPNLTG